MRVTCGSAWDSPEAVEALLVDEAVVAALATLPKQEAADFANSRCARRYLRANEGNITSAVHALVRTIEWRRMRRPANVVCRTCLRNPYSHSMRIVGIDDLGRVVIYTTFSQALDRSSPTEGIEHMTETMEDAARVHLGREARGVIAKEDKVVLVIDFYGYSFLVDSNPQTAVLAMLLLSHFPERLGRAVLVDAPSAFSATFRILKGIMNETTSSKIEFVRSGDGTLQEDLAAWAGEPLRTWISTEITENHCKASQNGRKAFWNNNGAFKGHDARCTKEFLETPEYNVTSTSRLEQRIRKPSLDTLSSESFPASGAQRKPPRRLLMILLAACLAAMLGLLLNAWASRIAVTIVLLVLAGPLAQPFLHDRSGQNSEEMAPSFSEPGSTQIAKREACLQDQPAHLTKHKCFGCGGCFGA